jgi:hypothetical protein
MTALAWDEIKKIRPNDPVPVLADEVKVPVPGKPGIFATVRRQAQLLAVTAADGTKTYTKASDRRSAGSSTTYRPLKKAKAWRDPEHVSLAARRARRTAALIAAAAATEIPLSHEQRRMLEILADGRIGPAGDR